MPVGAPAEIGAELGLGVRPRHVLEPAQVGGDGQLQNSGIGNVTAARRAGGARGGGGGRGGRGRRGRTATGTGQDYDPKAVRAWAESQGIQVSQRGRVPADLVAKFQEANA